MKNSSIVCSGLVVICLSGLVHAIDVDDPPQGVFSDEWYVLMLDGSKAGHMHSTMERLQGSGEDIIRSEIKMSISMGRDDVQLTVTSTQMTEETLSGEPRRFEQRMQLGRIPVTTRGTIRDGQVRVTKAQFGLPTTRTYDLPEGAMMSWAAYREQLKRGLEPGLKYELSVYEPSLAPDRLVPTSFEVFEPEELDLFGRKVTAYRTKQTARIRTMLGETPIDTITWMTDAGTAVKMQMSMPMVDMPFEVIAATKAVALAPDEPTELMVQTLIEAGRKLDPDSAKSISYRLITKGAGETPLTLPETAMQKIVENRGGAITLKLTRRSARKDNPEGEAARSATKPQGGDDSATQKEGKLELYLEPSADVNFDDPVVAELARKAAGDEKDPWKLTERLCRFVHEYVETKNLSIGFATASEVARSKEGDCTEHGVLLAALGRAVGIPSRIVTGIVYTDVFAGKRDVFVGHLWTQFWIDGEWVDVDAAFGQTDVDPTHIALGFSAAGDSGIADMVTSGWMNLSKLALKVIEVQD